MVPIYTEISHVFISFKSNELSFLVYKLINSLSLHLLPADCYLTYVDKFIVSAIVLPYQSND